MNREEFKRLFDSVEDFDLPWQELRIPVYKPYKLDKMELKGQDIPILRGYFRGLQPMPHTNYRLMVDDLVWMSVTPMELESNMPAVSAAKGVVSLMGLALYNLLLKPEVTKIHVVEIDEPIFTMLRGSTHFTEWPNLHKIEFHWENALDWIPSEPIDFLYADIWPQMGDILLRPHMQQMVKNQQPKECAAWTMELDFATWCAEKDRHPDTLDFLDYQEYCDDISLPLIFQSEELYAPLCIRAARNTYLM
jgi:hypothetical protein